MPRKKAETSSSASAPETDDGKAPYIHPNDGTDEHPDQSWADNVAPDNVAPSSDSQADQFWNNAGNPPADTGTDSGSGQSQMDPIIDQTEPNGATNQVDPHGDYTIPDSHPDITPGRTNPNACPYPLDGLFGRTGINGDAGVRGDSNPIRRQNSKTSIHYDPKTNKLVVDHKVDRAVRPLNWNPKNWDLHSDVKAPQQQQPQRGYQREQERNTGY